MYTLFNQWHKPSDDSDDVEPLDRSVCRASFIAAFDNWQGLIEQLIEMQRPANFERLKAEAFAQEAK